jgi:methylated-DNA-protein-cysteine methyltransferase related protein
MAQTPAGGPGTTGKGRAGKRLPAANFFEAVYRIVRLIPEGRVMTYGQIAALLGQPRAARAVGFAMKASGGMPDVPWHRVINAQGSISAKGEVARPVLQRQLLESEGVIFDGRERCDLKQYRWEPPGADSFYFETLREFPFR